MLKKWLSRLLKRGKHADLTPSPKLTPDPETARRLSEAQQKYADTGWLTKDQGRPYKSQSRQQ